MAQEIERLNNEVAVIAEEKVISQEHIRDLEGIKEQLIEADNTMERQHQMIVELQKEKEIISKQNAEWKEIAQSYKEQASEKSHNAERF